LRIVPTRAVGKGQRDHFQLLLLTPANERR
jgi:hypothetical protein